MLSRWKAIEYACDSRSRRHRIGAGRRRPEPGELCASAVLPRLFEHVSQAAHEEREVAFDLSGSSVRIGDRSMPKHHEMAASRVPRRIRVRR